MSYVIIGNSAAAIGAVESIRKVDSKTKITIISDEIYHTYSRPLISYLLSGKVTEERTLYRKPDFYEKNNVETLLGVKAVSIDTKSHQVILDNGKKVEFFKLLIATGGKPFIPKIEGFEKKDVYTFIKKDDVKSVAKVAAAGKKAVIVGAGLIGLKAAEALVKLGVQVTVVELANRALSAILDEDAASIVQRDMEEHGVNFILNNTITAITGNDKADGVILKTGGKLESDFVVIAIGVVPNTGIAAGTDIKVNRGIVVDETMMTSVPDIYAAGDVAEAYDILYAAQRVIPILPGAYMQGEVAGYNMAGREVKYDGGFAMNSIGFFNLPMITAGIIRPENPQDYEILTVSNPEGRDFKKIILRDNRVVGFIYLDKVDRAGIILMLMREMVDVSAFKNELIKDEFGFISLPKSLRKEKMLKGGVAS